MGKQIIDYDACWPEHYECEAQRLWDAVSALAIRIEHVGSTAVPGLVAKPTIDIQIAVPDEDAIRRCSPILSELGYCESGAPVHYFYRPATWPHTHHIHVRTEGTFDERRLRLFRDWLREHPQDRDAYGALKLRLAEHANFHILEHRTRYSQAKTEFVREIERRARFS